MICILRIDRASIVGVLVLLALVGCGKKRNEPAAPPPVGPSVAEIAVTRDALARGMQPISLDKLTTAQVGKRCVVLARSAPIPPPPPPLGTVRIMGLATLYMGQLSDISPGGIKIRAAYPGSGNYKYIEIVKTDIESLHISD